MTRQYVKRAQVHTHDEYVSTGEAGKILGVTTRSVQLLVDNGVLLEFRTPGGHRRLRACDVYELHANSLKSSGVYLYDQDTLASLYVRHCTEVQKHESDPLPEYKMVGGNAVFNTTRNQELFKTFCSGVHLGCGLAVGRDQERLTQLRTNRAKRANTEA